jgi:hypothetical protein
LEGDSDLDRSSSKTSKKSKFNGSLKIPSRDYNNTVSIVDAMRRELYAEYGISSSDSEDDFDTINHKKRRHSSNGSREKDEEASETETEDEPDIGTFCNVLRC